MDTNRQRKEVQGLEKMDKPESSPEMERQVPLTAEETPDAPEDTGTEAAAEESAAEGQPEGGEDAFTPHAPSGHTRLVTGQGLTADRYGGTPAIESERLSEEEEAEIGGIEVAYDLRKEEIVPGMRAFQHQVSFKKNLIYSALLIVIAVLYGQAVWVNPDYDMGKVFFGLSLFVLFMLWFMPYLHIRNTVKALEGEKMDFKLTVTPVGILIPDGDGQFLVRYSTPAAAAVELDNCFSLCVSREKVFILPKRCIPPEQLPQLKEMLQGGLRERYIVKRKNGD